MSKAHLFLSFLGYVLLTTNQVCGTALPARLAGWVNTESKTYFGQGLYDYINGGAELYLEYGFSSVAVGYYTKDEQELVIEVYKMSSPQAAMGLYSFFRDCRASPLPEPYTGAIHQSYLECLSNNEYIKLVNYDSLGINERLALLEEVVPKPTPVEKVDLSNLLPEKRIHESEVIFNGPIALKNFCLLGHHNFFGVGKRAKAYGCLIEIDGREHKWVTVLGHSDQLSKDTERFLAFQRRNDFTVRRTPRYDFLEDQLSDNNVLMIHRGDRIFWVFGIESEEKSIDLLRSIQ